MLPDLVVGTQATIARGASSRSELKEQPYSEYSTRKYALITVRLSTALYFGFLALFQLLYFVLVLAYSYRDLSSLLFLYEI